MFKKADFDNMFFQVDSEKNLARLTNAHLIPSLLKINDKQARFLIYLYDQGSPFTKQFPKLEDRQNAIREYIGSMPATKFEAALDLEDENNIDCIQQILKGQGNRVWRMIVSNEHLFDELEQNMIKLVEMEKDKDVLQSMKIKADLAKLQEEVTDRLEKYYTKLAGDHEEVKDRISASVRYSPETIANVS